MIKKYKFGIVTGVFITLGFILGSLFGPIDPFQQAPIAALVVGSSLLLSYLFVYRLDTV